MQPKTDWARFHPKADRATQSGGSQHLYRLGRDKESELRRRRIVEPPTADRAGTHSRAGLLQSGGKQQL